MLFLYSAPMLLQYAVLMLYSYICCYSAYAVPVCCSYSVAVKTYRGIMLLYALAVLNVPMLLTYAVLCSYWLDRLRRQQRICRSHDANSFLSSESFQ